MSMPPAMPRAPVIQGGGTEDHVVRTTSSQEPLLHVGPADRQLGGRAELLEHDRPVAKRRADERIAPALQRLEKDVQRLPVDRRWSPDADDGLSLHGPAGCEKNHAALSQRAIRTQERLFQRVLPVLAYEVAGAFRWL